MLYQNAPTMAKKLYYQNELTDEWKEGLEASIKVGKLRNHREKTTQRNDRDLALWVALDFQDMGIMSPGPRTCSD